MGCCVGTLDHFIFIAVGGGLVARVLRAEVGDARDARDARDALVGARDRCSLRKQLIYSFPGFILLPAVPETLTKFRNLSEVF